MGWGVVSPISYYCLILFIKLYPYYPFSNRRDYGFLENIHFIIYFCLTVAFLPVSDTCSLSIYCFMSPMFRTLLSSGSPFPLCNLLVSQETPGKVSYFYEPLYVLLFVLVTS